MNVALIPVRGGSEGIPKKNIRLMNGKPLMHWVIQAALDSYLDKVFVATDSNEIMKSAREIINHKLEIISRSPETATNIASTESVMIEFVKNNSFDYIALIQATSPLLTAKDINEAFDILHRENADSLLSCVRQKRFLWEYDKNGALPINYDYLNRPLRQNFNGFLVENGALYLTSRSQLIESQSRISGKIAIHEMQQEAYHEVDEEHDWKIVEEIMRFKDY